MPKQEKNSSICILFFSLFPSMLTQEEIDKIMKLSRLNLTIKEQKKYQQELSSILDFFEKLQEVNTDGIEPTAQVTGLMNGLREDTPENFPVGDLLQCSPQQIVGTQVSVKAIF